MFGSALGSPENQFQISDGWFSNITSLYDPRSDILTPAESFLTTSHNPYGFVDGIYNFQVGWRYMKGSGKAGNTLFNM